MKNFIAAVMQHTKIAAAALVAVLMTVTVLFVQPLLAQGDRPMLRMSTTLGVIEIELNDDAAPVSVRNFVDYVKSGHYDNLIFHRVIPGFMIQGGGFTDDMKPRPNRAPIENEADNGLKNLTGTLAMARTGDPHSATSQFFINLADNNFLDHTAKNPQGWGYAVLGKVVKGMDVVRKIGAQPTGTVGHYGDVPDTPIVIVKAEIVGG